MPASVRRCGGRTTRTTAGLRRSRQGLRCDGEDRREVAHDGLPALPAVGRRVDLAAGGAEVDAARVERVDGHRVAQDVHVAVRLGQTLGECLPVVAAGPRAVDAQAAARRVVLGVARDGHDEDGVRLVGVDGDREAEVARQVAAHLAPGAATVVAAQHVPVLLHEEHVGPVRVGGDAVDAVAHLRRGVGEHLGAQAAVRRLPGRARVAGHEHPGGGDSDEDPAAIGRVEQDGVQAHAAGPRLPALAAVARPEEGGVLDAGEDHVGVLGRGLEVPDARERPGPWRPVIPLVGPDRLLVGEGVADGCPASPAVRRALDDLAEPAARLGGVEAVGVGLGAGEVVDLPPAEQWAVEVPATAPAVGGEDERALARANEQTNARHRPRPPPPGTSRAGSTLGRGGSRRRARPPHPSPWGRSAGPAAHGLARRPLTRKKARGSARPAGRSSKAARWRSTIAVASPRRSSGIPMKRSWSSSTRSSGSSSTTSSWGRTSTSRKPARPKSETTRVASARAKGPVGDLPGAGGGGGGRRGSRAAGRYHGLACTGCQQTKASRPSARRWRATFAKAVCGSSKNITPNWLSAASNGPPARASRWTSATAKVTFAAPASRARCAAMVVSGAEMSAATTRPPGVTSRQMSSVAAPAPEPISRTRSPGRSSAASRRKGVTARVSRSRLGHTRVQRSSFQRRRSKAFASTSALASRPAGSGSTGWTIGVWAVRAGAPKVARRRGDAWREAAGDGASMDELWSEVDRFIEDRLVGTDVVLHGALEASAQAGLPAINVAPNQGKLLMLLAQIQGARRILEIGTLGGYSTIWLARALPADGRLVTLEVDPRHAEVASANLAAAGLDRLVEVRLGPALEQLPLLASEPPFDFVFIDADKGGYPEYLRWSLRLTRPGGLLVFANVVRAGRVVDPPADDTDSQAIRRLYDDLAASAHLSATAIQTVGVKGHDGLAFVRVGAEG